MPSIAVITDSDCSLTTALAEPYGIRQVPITIHFGEETFESGVTMDDAQLFERVDREGKLPTTSAPSPGQFVKAYQAAFDEGATQVICLCVSSLISATYSAAVTGRELMPERDITVIDTMNLSMGQGFMAMAAARAAQEGATRDEAVAHALDVGRRTHLFAALPTLKYLAMSGRVGHLAAGMAGLLNIKPILTVRDGKLELLEKVRTRKKAWARAIELTAGVLGGKPAQQMAILHVSVPQDAAAFQQELAAAVSCSTEIITTELSAGLSVHAGSGVVGVSIVTA